MHPSVQFSNTQKSSATPGEIDPADISINGAKYWQNNFMIDGISINNDLDPGSHGYSQNRQFDAAPSRSHGIALDADLLQEVKVYDSNVPVQYGGFNGGVVDAITRRPSKELHGKVSYATSRSEWARYHIAEQQREGFENASNEQYQPEFEKTTLRAMLEGLLTDNFGAIFAVSQRRSVIPLNGYSDGQQSANGDNRKNQTRQLDNYMLKTYWDLSDRLVLESSFTYAPQENQFFRENAQLRIHQLQRRLAGVAQGPAARRGIGRVSPAFRQRTRCRQPAHRKQPDLHLRPGAGGRAVGHAPAHPGQRAGRSTVGTQRTQRTAAPGAYAP